MNYTPHVTITQTSTSESFIPKVQKKKFFGKRRAYIDKTFGMRYSLFDTYEENKQDYYKTLELVFSGKCKDMFEAYDLGHKI